MTHPDKTSQGDPLPDEVISQLRKPRKLQEEVIQILRDSPKPVTTDEILIKLYQQFKLVIKRQNLKTQLWHLSEAGLIKSKHYGDAYSLPTEKGN